MIGDGGCDIRLLLFIPCLRFSWQKHGAVELVFWVSYLPLLCSVLEKPIHRKCHCSGFHLRVLVSLSCSVHTKAQISSSNMKKKLCVCLVYVCVCVSCTYKFIVRFSTPLWLFERIIKWRVGLGEEGSTSPPPHPRSLLFLLRLNSSVAPALKKVSRSWQWDIPLPWLHYSQNTHCCLIVTRWTLTAQPALTLCLLDTPACGTSPIPPPPTEPPELRLCGADDRWGSRLDGEVICAGTKRRHRRQKDTVCVDREQKIESLSAGAKRIRAGDVLKEGEVRGGKHRTRVKAHSGPMGRWIETYLIHCFISRGGALTDINNPWKHILLFIININKGFSPKLPF